MSSVDGLTYLIELAFRFRVELVFLFIILISIFADEIDRL
jgi:hypothetical protein